MGRGLQMRHQHDLIHAVVAGQPHRATGEPDDGVLAAVEAHPVAQPQHPAVPAGRGHGGALHTIEVSASGADSAVRSRPVHSR